MIREACVSGLFYQSDKKILTENIKELLKQTKDDKKADNIIAGIVPHAGYVYSGKTASYTYNKIAENRLPETIIIIGPNHTGYGENVDLTSSSTWQTPLGNIEVDTEFNNKLVETDKNCNINQIAHLREHAVEVELPFLQYIAGKQDTTFKIVPITVTQQKTDTCINLAGSIKQVAETLKRDCMIIASTDLTHYEGSDSARKKDMKVLKSIEDMNIEKLVNNINQYHITMCGYGPVITAISYAKLLNANSSTILNYSNSGDAFGDYESVVGYGSAIITK